MRRIVSSWNWCRFCRRSSCSRDRRAGRLARGAARAACARLRRGDGLPGLAQVGGARAVVRREAGARLRSGRPARRRGRRRFTPSGCLSMTASTSFERTFGWPRRSARRPTPSNCPSARSPRRPSRRSSPVLPVRMRSSIPAPRGRTSGGRPTGSARLRDGSATGSGLTSVVLWGPGEGDAARAAVAASAGAAQLAPETGLRDLVALARGARSDDLRRHRTAAHRRRRRRAGRRAVWSDESRAQRSVGG